MQTMAFSIDGFMRLPALFALDCVAAASRGINPCDRDGRSAGLASWHNGITYNTQVWKATIDLASDIDPLKEGKYQDGVKKSHALTQTHQAGRVALLISIVVSCQARRLYKRRLCKRAQIPVDAFGRVPAIADCPHYQRRASPGVPAGEHPGHAGHVVVVDGDVAATVQVNP